MMDANQRQKKTFEIPLGVKGGLVHLALEFRPFDEDGVDVKAASTDSKNGSRGMSKVPSRSKQEIQGSVVVEVLRASGLKKISQGLISGLMGDKQDPRVVVRPMWLKKNGRKSTKPHENGGSKPEWRGLDNVLDFEYDSLNTNKKKLQMDFDVVDDREKEDVLIGTGEIEWKQIFDMIQSGRVVEREVILQDAEDNPAGSLFVNLSFQGRGPNRVSKEQSKESPKGLAKEKESKPTSASNKQSGLVTIQIRKASNLPSSAWDTTDP